MRNILAFLCSTAIFATAGQAQTPVASPVPSPEGGVVHRLSAEDVDALFERKAKERIEDDRKAVQTGRGLNTAGRITTGALGFLGTAAAEASQAKKCGTFGLTCLGLSSNVPPVLDVLR